MVGLWDSPEEVKTEVTHERSSKWTKRRNVEEKLASGSPDSGREETVTGFQAGRCMENLSGMLGKRRNDGRMQGWMEGETKKRDQCCCWYLVIYSANVLPPFLPGFIVCPPSFSSSSPLTSVSPSHFNSLILPPAI